MVSWSPSWYIAAIVFFAVDMLLVVAYFIWLWKKRSKKEENKFEYQNLIDINSHILSKGTPTKRVQYSPDIFEIPGRVVSIQGNQRNLQLKPMPSLHRSKYRRTGVLDIDKYEKLSTKRKLSSIPRLGFELFYYFRTTDMQVSLRNGKYLPDYVNEQIIISVTLSKSNSVYHTARYDGPNPSFDEEFRFPLESMEISSDPPIVLKFNVWTVDKFSRKNPYGYVEANIEEIFTQYGLMPIPGTVYVIRKMKHPGKVL